MYLKVHAVWSRLRTPEGDHALPGTPRSRELRTSSERIPSTPSGEEGLRKKGPRDDGRGVTAQAQQYKGRNRPPRERRRTEAGFVPFVTSLSSHALGAPSVHTSSHYSPLLQARNITDREVEGSTHQCIDWDFGMLWPFGESWPLAYGDRRPRTPSSGIIKPQEPLYRNHSFAVYDAALRDATIALI